MGTRLSPFDAAWYLGENAANPMMISSIMWFDRELDVDHLRAAHREIIERHPVFRERIVPSRTRVLMPRWEEDPDFDLDRHLTVSRLPEPGDHATLERLCSKQRSTSLDRDRPLWNTHVFQGYRGGSAVHVRLHHSIGDGIALMGLMLALADEVDVSNIPLADDHHETFARELLHRAEHAIDDTSDMARHPSHAVRRLRNGIDATKWAVKLLAPALPQHSILIGRPNGVKHMTWDPDGMPLDAIKAAGTSAGATVNDVLLAVLTGALHDYLSHHAALVEDALVMVPVNLRPSGQPLPRHLGNQIGLLPVLLPVGLDDSAERLAVLQQRVGELKDSPAPTVSRFLLAATSLVTPAIERGIHRLNQIRSTGVVTNVPGPALPLHIGGANLEGIIGWGGMTGHLNLGVAFISLNGRVFTGVVTDEGITPDPERILDALRAEWRSLEQKLAA